MNTELDQTQLIRLKCPEKDCQWLSHKCHVKGQGAEKKAYERHYLISHMKRPKVVRVP